MATWKERAEALLTDVLAIAEIQKPGDVEHAVKALRDATSAWKCSHQYASARQPMAAFGWLRAAMIRALRAGVNVTEPMERKCDTCGARPMVECIPMDGEIAPGATHAARLGQATEQAERGGAG